MSNKKVSVLGLIRISQQASTGKTEGKPQFRVELERMRNCARLLREFCGDKYY